MKRVKKSSEHEIVLAELNAKRLKLFQKTVFGAKDHLDSSSVKVQFFKRNLKTIQIGAVIVLATKFFWLVVDMMRGGELNLMSGPALATIAIQMLLSIYMLALPSITHDTSGKMVEYSLMVYYIFLILDVTVLTMNQNAQMFFAGTEPSLAGVSISTYYLFIIVFAPLPSFPESIMVVTIMAATLFIPCFTTGSELYSLSQQSIVRVCTIVAYWYTRDVNLTLARSIQQLSVSSIVDPLTNVLNRRALDTYWDDIVINKRAESVGVLMFDVDDFKKYNDYYSHSKGDDVLVTVCSAVLSALEDDDSFLFRYGGEEFVVLLLNKTDDEIIRIAKQVNRAVCDADISRQDDPSCFDKITVTIGCSREPALDPNRLDYIINADKQLYLGKDSGKNCVVFQDIIYREGNEGDEGDALF